MYFLRPFNEDTQQFGRSRQRAKCSFFECLGFWSKNFVKRAGEFFHRKSKHIQKALGKQKSQNRRKKEEYVRCGTRSSNNNIIIITIIIII